MMNLFTPLSTLVVLLVLGVCGQDEDNIEQSILPYPTYSSVPTGLSFTCKGRDPGYYADTEARCQVWHWCLPSGAKYSFLCPNQTLFNQLVRVCDWWFNVDCEASPSRYDINQDLYKTTDGGFV